MNREKKHLGNLNIGKEIVSLDTDLTFKVIEISYVGTIKIKSLLPDNYMVANGNNKIIIVKTIKDNNIISDLFSYKGMAMITRCKLATDDLKLYNLYINKSNLELWNTLIKTESSGTTAGTQQDWAYMTKFWEDIDYDGNNNKLSYIHRKTIYDKETKTYTTTKEIRKK